MQCMACGGVVGSRGVCSQCPVPYSRAWMAGERSGALENLIDSYKFQRVYDAHKVLADLLLECLDELPPETIVVPVPTIAAHIRERGYDHTMLIAKEVAKQRGLRLKPLLYRLTSTKQRGANRKERIAQAKAAFGVRGAASGDVPYLLVDDVVTTGATMEYAARALQEAGASTIWAVAIARQPLD